MNETYLKQEKKIDGVRERFLDRADGDHDRAFEDLIVFCKEMLQLSGFAEYPCLCPFLRSGQSECLFRTFAVATLLAAQDLMNEQQLQKFCELCVICRDRKQFRDEYLNTVFPILHNDQAYRQLISGRQNGGLLFNGDCLNACTAAQYVQFLEEAYRSTR